MTDTTGPSFVLSINDLEAAMICALVQGADNAGQALGQVVDLGKPWGRTGSASLDNTALAGLAGTVVLVEVNSPHLLERLKNAGKEVVPIDHHLYQSPGGGALDLRSGFSSLEQVIKYTGHQPAPRVARLPAYLDIDLPDGRKLTFAELARLISANDRGHIPLLAEEARAILGLGSCKHEPPVIKHQAPLWEVKEQDLKKISQGWEQKPATWDGEEQKPAAWQDLEALVRDIRLRETALGHWLLEGNPLEELAKPEVFERQYKVTADLLRQAVNYISCAEGRKNLRLLATGRDNSDDPALYLIQAPIRYRKVLLDALYFWRAQQGYSLEERLSALFVFQADDDEDTPRLVEFYGSDEQSKAVAQWFEPATRQAWGTTRLEFWSGGGPGCFFGAEDRLHTEGEALSKLANHILDTVLTGNRPLERWRTSFLQPLRFRDPEVKDQVLSGLQEAAALEPACVFPVIVGPEEHHYFLPHAGSTLAPESLGKPADIPALLDRARRDPSLASFRRHFEGLFLQLVLPNHPKPVWLPVASVRLHFFYHSVMVLEWVISDDKTAEEDQVAGLPDEKTENKSAEPKEYPPDPPYWKSLLNTDKPRPLSLAQVLDINAKLRECYSTYSSEGSRGPQTLIRLVDGGQIAGALLHGGAVHEDRLSSWFAKLVTKALGLQDYDDARLNKELELLSDDRARVVSSLAPAGAYPDTPWGRERFEEILARFNTVDPYGQGHFYERRVALKELRQGLYDRFRADGSLLACSPHSLVFLGFGWFPTEIVHKRHMATMYRRMFLVALFYQSILHALALSLNKAGVDGGAEVIHEQALKELRRQLIYFTNHLWFRRLSSQVQGVELFDLLSARLGLDEQYREIADEIERAESFHTAEARERAEEARRQEAEARRQAEQLAAEARQRTENFHRVVAFWGAPLALFVALLTIPPNGYFYVWGYLQQLAQGLGNTCCYVKLTLLLGVCISIFLTWVCGGLFYLAIKKWRHK
ncbi:MAG: hypothetical protein KQJ78_20210 [Deltaproteobacteria bacterium]|nr:hypothetical protein [Deltaproteobacteria bacterium]